ncbi:hypothetical protein E5676_scaffold265G00680 [Cucumis melo var. makuwa]|uniref:Uncharacterized protein n=1 Tax=Cucumis melo var. makuwa TaxID=1194695 RepID=A0A5D3C9D9_CUCMM|nr:hypothetical protein E5676_scaffold265G00680 [Cucumis melo var. makuwa]
MSKDRKVNGAFIHFQGGKLYGMSITGHMLYDVLMFPNGLNPSEESANLTFRASEAKQGYCSSKCFQPSASAGCRSRIVARSSWRGSSWFVRPSLCSWPWFVVAVRLIRAAGRGSSDLVRCGSSDPRSDSCRFVAVNRSTWFVVICRRPPQFVLMGSAVEESRGGEEVEMGFRVGNG